MKKLKPERESPVDLDNQRGTLDNDKDQISPVSDSVKTTLQVADKVYEDEGAMYKLLRPIAAQEPRECFFHLYSLGKVSQKTWLGTAGF